jgi:hypothetical protein
MMTIVTPAGIWQRLPLCPFDRIIAGHVDISCAGCVLDLGRFWDARVIVALGRRGDVDLPDLSRFFYRFLGPRTGVDVIGNVSGSKKIHRNHRKLQAGATLKQQDFVV